MATRFISKKKTYIFVLILLPILLLCVIKTSEISSLNVTLNDVFITDANITDTSIEIFFETDSENNYIEINYRLDSSSDWIVYYIKDANTFSYTLDNLNNSQSVEFRIRSYSKQEYGSWSETVVYTTKQGEIKTNGFHFYVIDNSLGFYYTDYRDSSTKSDNFIEEGTGYVVEDIIEYDEEVWFKFSIDNNSYYIKSDYCLINLEEFLPALIYNITNSYSCIYESNGYKLSITGSKLYSDDYVPTLMYSTAVKLYYVEALALLDNNTIVVYDAYRPTSVSKAGADALNELYNTNSEVRNAINQNGFSKGWFVAQNISSHNFGIAVDVTLANNFTKEESSNMPSNIQELSAKAIKYTKPCYSYKEECTFASSMTEDALTLHSYFKEIGFVDLASEWWHFQEYSSPDYNKYINHAILSSGMDFWSNIN